MAFTTPGTAVAGDVLTAAFWNLQVRDNINSLVEAGSALPSSPIDGQSFYYTADTTNGIVWHLRYRSASASAYKWEYVGGAPLTSGVLAEQGVPVTNAFSDLATVGPSVTVPLAGDYVIEWQASALVGTTPDNVAGVGISVGGTDPASYGPGVSLLTIMQVLNSIHPRARFTGGELKTGIAASSVIKHRYRQNQGNNTYCYFSSRFLSVRPVRVG